MFNVFIIPIIIILLYPSFNYSYTYVNLSNKYYNYYSHESLKIHNKYQSDQYYNFIPTFIDSITDNNTTVKWESNCFKDNNARLEYSENNELILIINIDKPSSLFCYDLYTFSLFNITHTKTLTLKGKHEINFGSTVVNNIANTSGVYIFYYTNSISSMISSMINTKDLFIGSYANLEQYNIQFIKEKMNYTYKPRSVSNIIINASQIRTGDIFLISRFDGIDPLIMWGTGSHIGHTAFAIWINDELYICESTDKNPFGKVYWPPPYGIIKTPYNDWINYSTQAKYMVSVIKLTDEYYDKLNHTQLEQFVNDSLGLPYGYKNFIYGWIDTPSQNFPYPLSYQLLETALLIAEKHYQEPIDSMFTEGLNKRFKLDENTSLPDTLFYLKENNITFGDAISMPESDSWYYNGNKSMVCDVFILSAFKNAGLFDELYDYIQVTEFTPKDLYQLKIFNESWTHVEGCEHDKFCQIMGDYTMELPNYNTVEFYKNMNNNCPSEPIEYIRPDGC